MDNLLDVYLTRADRHGNRDAGNGNKETVYDKRRTEQGAP